MSVTENARTKIFISYSHTDSEWLERLQVHLKPIERQGLITRWDDTKIRPSDNWREEIQTALDSANIAVLLISADFMGSDFIAENELPPLLSAAENSGVTILSLILSPSLYEDTESISKYQSVNPPSKPLINLTKGEQEKYLVELARTIMRSVEAAQKKTFEIGSDIKYIFTQVLEEKVDKARTKVFFVYSHKDREWLERVQVHLKPYERQGLITRWDDTKIHPSTNWQEEIRQALDAPNIAVLLISANFLASDFIAENELPQLLDAAKTAGVTILSLILSPCLYEETESISKYQSINPPSKPLIKLSKGEQEKYLVELARTIMRSVEAAQKKTFEIGSDIKYIFTQAPEEKVDLAEQVLKLEVERESLEKKIRDFETRVQKSESELPTSDIPKEKVRIFLSYASEDLDRVRVIYDRLLDAGYFPWLDRVHLLPGQNWEITIKKALKESDFVLVCLSGRSINKRSFLQKEIKHALEHAQEKLDDDVWLIPARLDDCPIPESLSTLQWVDWFHPTGFDRLIEALAFQLKKLGKAIPNS